MAREADVACRTRADATRQQGHVAEPREPTRGLGGVDTWQGPRESTRAPGWHHVAVWGLEFGGPTG